MDVAHQSRENTDCFWSSAHRSELSFRRISIRPPTSKYQCRTVVQACGSETLSTSKEGHPLIYAVLRIDEGLGCCSSFKSFPNWHEQPPATSLAACDCQHAPRTKLTDGGRASLCCISAKLGSCLRWFKLCDFPDQLLAGALAHGSWLRGLLARMCQDWCCVAF